MALFSPKSIIVTQPEYQTLSTFVVFAIAIAIPGYTMPEPFHGSCLCKAIEFQVDAAPVAVSTCHCLNCKKYTGTAFTTNVIFPHGSAKITKGTPSTYHDSAQDSGNALARVFCPTCSSPLFNLGGDFGKTLAVFYGALDDFNVCVDPHPVVVAAPPGARELEVTRTAVAPQVEYYVKDRVSWVSPVLGAEQAQTKPGR
ncbi:Mss4-like protein [Cristinia sonorae]|uniref:Mss4-like protein n=1 Tax=Cristinia sonorae TaxID=1940300 RepID=A0A8K0V0Z8_9AGAR|nr:Mss4-like protein [Cristinia sonorae]